MVSFSHKQKQLLTLLCDNMEKLIIEEIKQEINACISIEEITNVVNKYQIDKDVSYEFDDEGNLRVSNTGFNAQDIHHSCNEVDVKIANTMNDLQKIIKLDNPIRLELYSLHALNFMIDNNCDYNQALKHTIELYNEHQQNYMLEEEVIHSIELDLGR